MATKLKDQEFSVGYCRIGLASDRLLPPPEGFVKIKVDGATSNSLSTGASSAICRSQEGLFLGASSICFQGISDPASLEAMACREALALAADLGESRVIVVSDCKAVVEDIQMNTGGLYGNIIREIRMMIRNFTAVSFVFEGRASNREADSLAKHSVNLDSGRHLWLIHPPVDLQIPVSINVEL